MLGHGSVKGTMSLSFPPPRLIEALQGNEVLARGMVIRFIENTPPLILELRDATALHDASTAHGVAYRLRSHYRALGLFEALHWIDQVCKSMQLPNEMGDLRREEAVDALMALVDDLSNALKV